VSWSYWHRGTISLASTVALLNVLTDEEIDKWDKAKATGSWATANALLWPELWITPIAKGIGFKGPAPLYLAVAAGVGLGVAGTFVAIELTADSPEQKASMQEDARDLFLPQFAGGKSWDELDYFGTLWEGGSVVVDEVATVLKKYWNLGAPRQLFWNDPWSW